MWAKKLDGGQLLIPMRAEGPNGELGNGWVRIGPDHPDYKRWLADAEKGEQLNGARADNRPQKSS
jgi:hypothetical protein